MTSRFDSSNARAVGAARAPAAARGMLMAVCALLPASSSCGPAAGVARASTGNIAGVRRIPAPADLAPAVAAAPVAPLSPPPDPTLQQARWAAGQLPGSGVKEGKLRALFEYEPLREPDPRWLRFEVQPDETLEDIAERFGVQPEEIARWNRLKPGTRRLRWGRKLRIRARKFPTPRWRLHYWVKRGDSWESIARAFDLPTPTLRRFNRAKQGPLQRGQRLTLWAKSALPKWGNDERQSLDPVEVVVPAGATSRGYPARGRLVDGMRLPDSELYTLKRPPLSYASTSTMAQLQRGIAAFRRRTGFEGKVWISSASRRRGGRFLPHRSHQSGRDVDVGLVAFPIYNDSDELREHKIDWGANWALIREFVITGEVEFVFLTYPHQRKLHDAARAMGEADATLRRVFQYPKGPNALGGVIRHEPGHDRHFHVRWRCGPSDGKCRTQVVRPSLRVGEPAVRRAAQAS